MVVLKKYNLNFDNKNNIYLIRADETLICPLCMNTRLYVIGSRKRKYIDIYGVKKFLLIRRLRCGKCGKIHHELPDIVTSYKRHCTQTIKSVIKNDIEDLCCEESTIKKIKLWWNHKILKFNEIPYPFGILFKDEIIYNNTYRGNFD